jgi:hypothetical protein
MDVSASIRRTSIVCSTKLRSELPVRSSISRSNLDGAATHFTSKCIRTSTANIRVFGASRAISCRRRTSAMWWIGRSLRMRSSRKTGFPPTLCLVRRPAIREWLQAPSHRSSVCRVHRLQSVCLVSTSRRTTYIWRVPSPNGPGHEMAPITSVPGSGRCAMV